MDSAASCRSCIPFICIPPTMAAPHCSYARLPSHFSFDFSFSLANSIHTLFSKALIRSNRLEYDSIIEWELYYLHPKMSIHNMHGWRDLEVRRQKISRHSAGTMKCGRVQKCEGGYFDTVSEILPSGFVVTRSAGAAAAVAGIEYSSSGFQNSNRSIFLFFFPNKKCINGDHLDFHIFLSLSLDCHIC